MDHPKPIENATEQSELTSTPGRKIHLAALANIAGIVVFYAYYLWLNPDPDVGRFWRSNQSANILFVVLAALPFILTTLITRPQNRWMKETVQKGRKNWSQEDISGMLDYLFMQPKTYFLFSFFAWAFEGALWGLIIWLKGEKPFGESFLITFLGSIAAGSVAALIAFIIADKITRQVVFEMFPHLDSLDRPVNLSLRTTGLIMLCVVGVMPVLILSYVSYFHAEQAVWPRMYPSWLRSAVLILPRLGSPFS